MSRLAVFLLLLATTLSAQTFRGSISGNIVDSSGAALPDALVKATNDATGYTRSTVASGSGDFLLPELPVGIYTVLVNHEGFQSQKLEKVEVAVSKVSNLSVHLSVAQQASTVEVSASALTVETTSTALVGVVNTQVVADLPMNGRDFRQMLKLSPGVSPTTTAVNGSRGNGNNFQIDGADNNDAFQNAAAVNQGGVAGIAGTLLPIEAIDQFSVQTNGSAEVGRNGGGAVNLVIKSGTNALHGSLYYFNRNEALAENSPFATPGSKKRKIRNNQYGFAVGGPVQKNKTFYFLTGEAQQAVAGNGLLATSPSDAWVEQAKQTLAAYNVPVNPAMTSILSVWPARTRNGPAVANNYLSTDQNDYNSYNGIAKVDHVFNEKHSLAVRYYGGTGTQTAQVSSPFREYFQVAPSRMHNYSAVMNNVLSPRLVLQTTVGVNYFKQTFNDADTSPNPVALGFNTGVTDPFLLGSPTMSITGFAGVGSTQPLGRVDVTGHITEGVTYVVGRHQIKLGGEYRHAYLDIFYETNKRGNFTFDGNTGPWRTNSAISSTQRALADFLAGYVSTASGARIVRGQLQRDYRQNSFDWWVHDTFQISSRLSLNFGVRYTYQGPLYDTRDSITNFIPGTGFVVPGKDVDTLYPKDWNNFAPRFGFAYTLDKAAKTVVRGGYGLFYDVPAINFFTANTGVPNGGAAGVNANPGGPSPVYSLTQSGITIQPGVPIFGAANPIPPFGVQSVSQDFRTAYVQNFNLNVQRQLTTSTVLQVGYVGSLGHKLPILRNLNAPIPGTTGSVQSRRPYSGAYPTLAAINDVESIANSEYNSMQASIRQSFWHGVTAQFAYTWSHAIDNGSNGRNTLPANSYDMRSERGNAAFDIRHIFTTFISYDVPSAKRWKQLTGGWQLNSLITAHTGEPIDLRAGTNVSLSGDSLDRVNLIGDPYAGVVQPTSGTAVRYFNPAAFATPAAGTFGNLGRNALYGPGFGAMDFSVFKSNKITERISTQFRVEIFNIFNRTNYANPGTSLASSTSFGLMTSTRNGGSAPGIGFGEPRNAQLALKIIF